MVGAAVGLATCGKIPFVSTFAAFFTRAFDHIRMAGISGVTIKYVGSHCGVSIGEDGPSQMGLEDLAMMRAVPHSTVLYLGDAVLSAVATYGVRVYKLAVTEVPRSGKPEELLDMYGISARRIVEQVKSLLAQGVLPLS